MNKKQNFWDKIFSWKDWPTYGSFIEERGIM